MDGLKEGPAIQSVIFDFDYTLADSSDGVIDCVNYALQRLELPTAGDDAIRHTIGMSLPRTLTTLVGDEHAERSDEFMRLFIERADVVLHDMITLYEYVPFTVDLLQSSGLTLGIVSSKYRRRIEQVLRRDGMEGKFAFIVGGEDVEVLKPDPTGLLRAMGALGTPKERCLYVGDSLTDAETARRAGMRFAAVLSGVTEREAFADHTPAAVLRSAGELPAALGIGMGR